MFKFFSIGKPGPTDLDWEQKNSADYLYRPADLSALKVTLPEEEAEYQKKTKDTEKQTKE